MFFKILFATYVFGASLILHAPYALAMGGKPEISKYLTTQKRMVYENAPTSTITMKELALLFWPDSNATQVQQEEALKNLLGKKVNWKIVVAQIQREGDEYLIQGQSDKDRIGTFSYIVPTSEAEKDAIIHASMGTKLNICGVVNDMRMRHIVLKPAYVKVNN